LPSHYQGRLLLPPKRVRDFRTLPAASRHAADDSNPQLHHPVLNRFKQGHASMLCRVSSIIAVLVLLLLGPIASTASADEKLSKQQLDQLLAPIALYPDDLLTNVLMASTYPVDVVEANRWVTQPENAQLKGDALAKALEGKDWDPSIKALVQFPSVLATMSDKLDWTQKVGDAFLAQPAGTKLAAVRWRTMAAE
jgi:hypothetical protein